MSPRAALWRCLVTPVLVAVGVSIAVAASGCRLLPTQPETAAPATVGIVRDRDDAPEGDRVALVREAMIESAAMSEGPPHSDQAREAVRVWRGQGGATGGVGGSAGGG